ncbi:adenosylcobalamin-dependent ribonucleoside-diphosphate reductase [Litoreibacter sp.]|nr:adenosylcobalamin-dependent ribonucleoside-diphosphate reductase [Litoreibacter sp.]
MTIAQEIDEMKYRQKGETFNDKISRIARTLSDGDEHRFVLEEILGEMRFLPAGRVQSAIGSDRITTAYNCFVSGDIDDSMESIMQRASEAAETMRKGGGIGYDFSKLRPRGDHIKSLDSKSSGPISFMQVFDAVCQTIASSGHRRGAQMGVLRIDHPDILDFVRAKRNNDKLTGFNISVGITDAFMEALDSGSDYDLYFNGEHRGTLSAQMVWDEIMSSTWDWAEPGVLFVDRIKEMNNLWYCEEIYATNPCGEQPLPAYGACLLGSFNLTKYLEKDSSGYVFNFDQFKKDIPEVVRAMDNVVDRTIYPLKAQEDEAKNKRRMGLGVTGMANAGEMLGYPYASKEFMTWAEKIFACLRDNCYKASALLAKDKGSFPLFRKDYLKSNYIRSLPASVQSLIREHGIRNSHLTSIAPTGTISIIGDNVSGGIEPVFSHKYDRTIQTFDGPIVETVKDYAYSHGVEGRTADSISVNDHLKVLLLAQHYIDSACSKTCNVSGDVDYDSFKQVYVDAWKGGAKGCTTFRINGKRFGIFNETVEEKEKVSSEAEEVAQEEDKVEACFIDPTTGIRECA